MKYLSGLLFFHVHVISFIFLLNSRKAHVIFIQHIGYVFVALSCLTLCNPMDYSLPSSSVHGILQTRILEWVAIPFSGGSSQQKEQTHVSCIDRLILYRLSHQRSPYSVYLFKNCLFFYLQTYVSILLCIWMNK